MKTREEILSILKKEMPHLREEFHVRAIGLFGSYSREQQKEGSDIDLLAEFGSTIDFVTLFRLEDHLSERLGSRVEIVTPGGLKERIRPYIMRDIAYA